MGRTKGSKNTTWKGKPIKHHLTTLAEPVTKKPLQKRESVTPSQILRLWASRSMIKRILPDELRKLCYVKINGKVRNRSGRYIDGVVDAYFQMINKDK